ncbi:MAG: hypothetical protein GWN56_11545, partial [Nitrosopumilaceae archaeon]|nr:hypothetical protein [Nitrosopumilaceae archaeon]
VIEKATSPAKIATIGIAVATDSVEYVGKSALSTSASPITNKKAISALTEAFFTAIF